MDILGRTTNRLARLFVSMLVLIVSVAVTTADGGAQEEPAVVRALIDSAAINAGARPTYDSIDLAPDGTITLSGYKTSYQAEGDPDTAMSYTVETLRLSDVTETGIGLFEVGSAEWSNTTVSLRGESVAAVPLMTAKSLIIHQPGSEPTALQRFRASNVLAREFSVPEALVMVGGQSIVIEGMSGTWEGDPMTGAGTSQFTAKRIRVPGALFEGDDNPLAMAGYEELELAIEGNSTTTFIDEAVGFDIEMRLDGRDVGSLIVELGADGIPLALFGEIDAEEPDPDALMPFAEGISLKRARIRFEDASLTGRLLALLAEEQNTDVASFVADTTAGLDAMLAESLDPELARQVSSALTAYLNDPQSITFALAPAQPVHFAQAMAMLENPAALIDLLRVSVTAND